MSPRSAGRASRQPKPPTGREAPPGTEPACYGYARVSTVHQADEGESLDVQQRQLAGYAQMQD
jgi:hypothetical protein